MEILMRNLILSSAAAMALAAVPAFGQDKGSSPDTSTDTSASASADAQPAGQPAPPVQSADEANAQAAPAPATTTVETDAATGAGAVVTNFPGNVTPPPPANKSYPVCSRKIQESARIRARLGLPAARAPCATGPASPPAKAAGRRWPRPVL
ncbi:MAG: hypothetical protein ACXWJC_04110 [Croceibacterium sp.]